MCTMMGCSSTDPDSDDTQTAAAAAAAAAAERSKAAAAASTSKAHSGKWGKLVAAVVIGAVLVVAVVGGVIVHRSKMSGNGRGQLSNVENTHINPMYEQAPIPNRPLVEKGEDSAC